MTHPLTLASAGLLALALFAPRGPAAPVPAGSGSAAAAAAAAVATPAALESGTYAVDPVHSAVLYRVLHLGASPSWGRFNSLSGEIVIDAEDAAKSRVALTIDAASIDSGNEKRDQHLRSPDFFSVKEFPEITFVSDSVRARGETGYDVTGKLTLHGVTKPVTLQVERTGAGPGMGGAVIAGFEARFTLNRSDYDFGAKFEPGVLGEEVSVVVAIEAAKG